MSERKPPGVSWETWIDRQIEEGRARGDFDGLPGHGRPIPGIERPRDELWWIRDKLRREGVDHLPPALAIRREAAEAEQRALAAPTLDEARRILEEVNERIRHLNRYSASGPPTTLMAFDIDETLQAWRPPPALPAPPEVPAEPSDQRPPVWARVRAGISRRRGRGPRRSPASGSRTPRR